MPSDIECVNHQDAKERRPLWGSFGQRFLLIAGGAILASLLPQPSLSQTPLLTKEGCNTESGYVYDQLLTDGSRSNALFIVLRRDSAAVRRQLGIDFGKLPHNGSEVYSIQNGWIATFYLSGDAVFSLAKVGVAGGNLVATATTYFDAWGAKLNAGVAIDGLIESGGNSMLYGWGGGEGSAPPSEIIVTSTCANLILTYQYSPNGLQWENAGDTKTYLETLDGLTDALGSNSLSSCTWLLTRCLKE